jgi:hypothetical protein
MLLIGKNNCAGNELCVATHHMLLLVLLLL